jgi:hypothetical protein
MTSSRLKGNEILQKNDRGDDKIIFGKSIQYPTAKEGVLRFLKYHDLLLGDFIRREEYFSTRLFNVKNGLQIIEGLCPERTNASAETLYKLSNNKQNEILDAYSNREIYFKFQAKKCVNGLRDCLSDKSLLHFE